MKIFYVCLFYVFVTWTCFLFNLVYGFNNSNLILSLFIQAYLFYTVVSTTYQLCDLFKFVLDQKDRLNNEIDRICNKLYESQKNSD